VSYKASYFAEQLGYDVTIIVTEGMGRSCYFPLSDKVQVINFELGFEALWQASFAKKIILFLTKQRQYKRLLKAELLRIRPDITISTLRREINFLSSINDGSVKIGELHVNRANYRSMTDANLIKRLFSHFWMKSLIGHLAKLKKMVVLTDNALNDWPELNNLIKIPDPLPFKADIACPLSAKRVISIGRYDYDKGNDLLLKIWSIVEKRFPDWRLDIYGMGDQLPYISIMNQLGINENRCELHGPLTDVKNEYLSSSIFVLPSRFEGFGLVLIEAMACGVPVVSFDCENGPRSIISDSIDGFLIPTFDIDKMGANARKSAERYDIDRVGMQWKHLFDDLIADR